MKANSRAATAMQTVDSVGGSVNDFRQLLRAMQSVRDGDFSVALPGHWAGLSGKIADTFNEIVAINRRMAAELQRVGRVVGKEGQTRQRVSFGRASGAWGEM